MIRSNNIYYPREVREMKEQNKKDQVIDFCLKHELIKKTDHGYIIKREFFEILDLYNE